MVVATRQPSRGEASPCRNRVRRLKIDPPQKCWTPRSTRFHRAPWPAHGTVSFGPGDRVVPPDYDDDVVELHGPDDHDLGVDTARCSSADYGSPPGKRRSGNGNRHIEARAAGPTPVRILDSVTRPVRASRSPTGHAQGPKNPAKDTAAPAHLLSPLHVDCEENRGRRHAHAACTEIPVFKRSKTIVSAMSAAVLIVPRTVPTSPAD